MEWKVLGDMEEKKPQEVKLEIQLDEEMAQGAYVNLAVVNASCKGSFPGDPFSPAHQAFCRCVAGEY
jgi:hypothetical protein